MRINYRNGEVFFTRKGISENSFREALALKPQFPKWKLLGQLAYDANS